MDVFEEVAKKVEKKQNDMRLRVCIDGMPYHEIVDIIGENLGDWYRDEAGTPIRIVQNVIRPLNGREAQYIASQQMDLYRHVEVKKNGKPKVIEKSENPINSFKLEDALINYPAPRLRRIVKVPYFNKKWTLIHENGYDVENELYYIPSDLIVQPLSLDEAKQVLGELTKDMLFKDSIADFANYVGYLLTPLIQPALNDNRVPIHIFRKNQRGTGATTAVNILGYIYYKQGVQLASLSDDIETKKLITTAIKTQVPVLNFDDYMGTLARQPLVQYLTSRVWTDRILGGNEICSVESPSLWFVCTTNNGLIGSDMARRSTMIEFETTLEHPENRPLSNIEGFVFSNRNKIFSALVCLINNWSKKPGKNIIGDFVDWCSAIDGILRDADIPGFQANRNSIQAIDIHAEEFTAFLHALFNKSCGQEFYAKDVLLWCQSDLEDTKPVGMDKACISVNHMGRWLTSKISQPRGGLILRELPRTKKGKSFVVQQTSQFEC
jgi:hypothetical protein